MRSAIVVSAPGASGRGRRTSSAVQERRRAPSAPPAVTATRARAVRQPPNAFAHARSHTDVSGRGPVFANAIRSVPASANRRRS
jgi:hypothetical protein